MEVDDFDLMIVRQFIGENWRAFESHCKACGTDPEVVLKNIGGTPE